MPASFIMPADCKASREADDNIHLDGIWTDAIEAAEQNYKRLIQAGAPPQIARSVFPNALASRIIVTGNLRNWRHFFIMRTTREAHPQMREVTIPLLIAFKEWIPLLYDDIEPMAKQSESMRRAR
jgi:thymidylate synthase (FAD)